jgi:hypothetical protein
MRIISGIAIVGVAVVLGGAFLNAGAPTAATAPAANAGSTSVGQANLATDITVPTPTVTPTAHTQFQSAAKDLAIRAGKATLSFGEQVVIAVDEMVKSSGATQK